MAQEIERRIDQIQALVTLAIGSVQVHNQGEDFLVIGVDQAWMFRIRARFLFDAAYALEYGLKGRFRQRLSEIDLALGQRRRLVSWPLEAEVGIMRAIDKQSVLESVKSMTSENGLKTVRVELEAGLALKKCQQCGCMEGGLRNLAAALPSLGAVEALTLAQSVSAALGKMGLVQYTCLGCDHCYPAVAQNAFGAAYPALAQAAADLSCDFQVHDDGWPPVVGEYAVLDPAAPVAVSTLASAGLGEELAQRKPKGLAIVGKTETENIGIDKIIKNVVTSPTLRYLVVAGIDSKGHFAGQTLLALGENGVDEKSRVVGSTGRRPVLRNVSATEIQTFREQVQLVDMIGCEDLDEIVARIEALSQQAPASCGCSACGGKAPVTIGTVPQLIATESNGPVKMDKAGYFVILPLADKGVINVEHYGYDNVLLRVIEGTTARAIYRLIIDSGWVTELSHAAYLGKELEKAELSLQRGFKYVQDGA